MRIRILCFIATQLFFLVAMIFDLPIWADVSIITFHSAFTAYMVYAFIKSRRTERR